MRNSTVALLAAAGLCLLTARLPAAEMGSPPRQASSEAPGHVQPLILDDLIGDALARNHEILMNEARTAVLGFRVPQAESLPDPMIMFGYQNEGFGSYTYGKSPDAQWMFSASQTLPFPGKRSLRGEMAARDTEAQKAALSHVRLKTVERVKELFYDLLLLHQNLEALREKVSLFARLEDAALARYSSGKGEQQEALMVQVEKYMLLEREHMLKQKIQSAEAMLNLAAGRYVNAPLGRPVVPPAAPFAESLESLLRRGVDRSPLVASRERAVAAAEARVQMTRREYYPDLTLNGSYFKRSGEFDDMWSLTTSFTVPLFYRKKQRLAVYEAEALLSEARHEFEGTKLMLSSEIRDAYAMARTAENLLSLYRDALMQKASQDFESSLAGYTTGKVEALTVITRLKALIDFDTSYWTQFALREKALARIETLTGGTLPR